MNKVILFALLLNWPLLAAALEIDDRIIMALEEPAANSTASGVGNLRGWAIGPDGIDYVEFYVDGELKKEIPYGAARGDIGRAYPDYPDSTYSGFSSAYAYGLQDQGAHVLKVRAVSKTGKYKEVSNNFNVARFHKGYFPDPNAMDISSSTPSQDGKGILLNNIKVEGNAYDVRLEWQVPSQQFTIVKVTENEPPVDPPTQPGSSLLNDTGIVDCVDDGYDFEDCPLDQFPGQDAEYGRDATDFDNSDGWAGFSYTKLDDQGKPLSASADDWSCVKDNVTGLIWEVKTNDADLHDRDNTYSWYNPDSRANGGDPGEQDGGKCNSSDCDTHAFTQELNDEALCGFKDWRMPTIKELENIVLHYNDGRPWYEVNYFPNTQDGDYWSGTPSPFSGPSNWRWSLDFDLGTPYPHTSGSHYVRLVRGK